MSISTRTGLVFPSHTREYKRKDRLKELGWTPEMWGKVWEEQDGKCAICNKILNLDMKQNEARACADHEHGDRPKPRGILCSTCNIMLGQSQDSPETLRAGAEYLEKFLLETAEDVKQLIVSDKSV